MKRCVVLTAFILILSSSASGTDILIDYESRSSPDKVNVFVHTKLGSQPVEVYVLRTAKFIEAEVGPMFQFGPLKVVTRLGGVWRLSDNTPYVQVAVKFFFKQSRFTIFNVDERSLEDFSFKKPSVVWAYQEGFVLVSLDGLLSRCEVGVLYEHYRKDGQSVWVVGPRFDLTVKKGYLQKITFWAGITDNPTVTVDFIFHIDL